VSDGQDSRQRYHAAMAKAAVDPEELARFVAALKRFNQV